MATSGMEGLSCGLCGLRRGEGTRCFYICARNLRNVVRFRPLTLAASANPCRPASFRSTANALVLRPSRRSRLRGGGQGRMCRAKARKGMIRYADCVSTGSKQRRERRRKRQKERARAHATAPAALPRAPGHPSAAYAHPYETAKDLFGKEMSAAELIDRVQGFSWQGSFYHLASLAAIVANEPGGALSERVRRLTVDPIAQLAGSGLDLLKRARRAVRERRNRIVLAHEEAISFLQHLVLLEGGDADATPGDPEIALWLAGANGHLARW